METLTLIVVDMQKGFIASQNEAVKANVAREIVAARESGNGIIFTWIPGWGWDDPGWGPPLPELKALVRGYPHTDDVSKTLCPGAVIVEDACKRKGLSTKRFRVCGVNSDDCVLRLVIDLLKVFPDSSVDVVTPACNSCCQPDCWHLFPHDQRLSLVEN